MSKKIATIFVILVLIILLSAALFLNKPTAAQPPKPINGVLDLSNWSFENNGIVCLAGAWSFYFNRFLTHEDFVRGVNVMPTALEIPSTKESMARFKPFAENKFYGTMRLVIKLPEGRKTYGLRTGIILTSFKLYLDGDLQGEVGKVGASRENSVPYYNILTTYFNPESNEVELIYHTSDFTAEDCTIVAPKIGLASQISQEVQLGLGRDLFLFGMLLIMGIYHFGLYIMRTKDRAPLYFGVFCLLFSLRMLLVGERFLPSHLNLSFFVYGRMAYLSVFIGFAALCGFLYYTLDGLFPKWFVRVSITLGSLFGLLFLWIPYSSADRLLMIYAVFGFALLGYAMIRLVIGIWQSVPFANIVFLGFAFLGITFINDFIYQITLRNTPSLIPFGVAVFTLTQAYTLSARFSNAFTKAEQLSAENKAILSELKLLNSNLESLVKERTSDLQNALEEMEVMSKTDYLTKLPNRRLVFAKIKELIEQKRSFYIGLADIDHFKEINDHYGHVKGDEILVLLSSIISTAIGDCGFVGRWGGEEFLIVLEMDEFDSILKKANEIRRAVAEYRHGDIGKSITITVGLCQYRENTSLDILIARADEALYQGKLAGRNQCIFKADEKSENVV
ncbi:sensor domain-containing diguanylate cyclase [Desulfosporosinus meridiei]|uniref:Diguanylate cyclase (GGDEF) domain-containing protein n=1 Tax=Desulfosporosinus meridiei (strain ATCC BAA-275 / DSM 13257 / KCTC 12902 / NCIMB 13706 / S10) TaxID=768704 RepID=J7J1L6_DESMD|nr:diguanylate cyclase [Desulfosporosinus meridiei]AFQ44831.1 diguanylate cyclase (GGDEF) domain-containing protein [Desulfosporosinus meridiei DSM 13257]